MFDGAALATAAAVPDPNADAAHADAATQTPVPSTSADSTADRPAERLAAPDGTVPRREIAFIDTTVPNWQILAQDVRAGVETILLDPTRDGLAQIAEVLRGRSGLDAIHIVSHGSEGALILGGQSYGADQLSGHQPELTAIGQALSAGGDLLLYGCDIAKGSAGEQFIKAVADVTHADVAASTNITGAAGTGGDWVLEAATGKITSPLFADPALLSNYDATLDTINLSGNTGWVPVMIGVNFDPSGDSQAGAADTDLVGDATHAALYVAFDNGGTGGTASDDSVLFRIRVDNPTSTSNFAGVAIVGIDANLDGRVDLFFAVDGRNNAQSVRLFDPGTGLNNSPSNTTTTPLPTGWLPNNGVYPFSASNYSVTAVSASTDPNWNGNNDLGNDGKTDAFVTFKVPLADIATVLAKPSPVDRNGVYGPRGPNGIPGFDANTAVRYVLMSQTQPGPINGDLGGVGANYDKNATFDQLGTFTAPMSIANPVPAGASLTVIEPIGDGNLSATEDGSVTISGTSANLANGTSLTITISDTDSGTADVTTTATVNNNAWSVSGVNFASLADGTLTVTAQTASGATVIDSATVLHDRTPPVITVTSGTAYNDTTPAIAGTSDLPAGSVITVTVDPDNDSGTNNSLVYTTTVLVGGGWALDTGVVTPASGTFPVTGLPAYSKITASGTDAAGNSTTTTALNKPTVNNFTTNDTTPTISGTWTNLAGDTLTVTVNGVTYTTGTGLTINGNTWSLTTGTLALGTYDVVATVTRATGGTATDATTGELVVASGPAVTITGGGAASGADTTPLISGTTTLSSGDFVLVRIDPNNDGNLVDAVTYAVTVGAGGAWSVDTGTATPISGIFPANGITGNAGIVVTAADSNGNAATASQTLTVTVPSITTTSIETAISSSTSAAIIITGDSQFNKLEDDSVTVSGTSTNAVGSTVTVSVSDGTTTRSGSATVAANGAWSVTGLNLSTLKDGNLTVTASVLTASDVHTVTHDATAPVMYITTASTIDKTNPVLKGITDLPSGSTLTITVTKTSDSSAVASGTTTVGSDGRWTWQNSTNVIYPTGTNAVTITVTSTATDVAGNKVASTSKTQTVANNVSPPSIVVTAVTGVDYSTGDATITSAEIGSGITISGTSSSTSGTVSVSVTDGTTTISATPTTNGTWSMSLTKAQVQGFKNGTLTITATVTVSSITATSMYVPTLFLVTGTPTIAVTTPIDNGIINDAEDNSVSISGTTTNAVGSTVTLTVSDTDGSTPNVVGTAMVANDGTWTVSGLDLSGLVDGTLTVSGSVTANSTTATGSASVTHDKTAPVIAVTSGASATDTTPIISGTTDLPAGSTLTVTIDPNNDGVLTDQVIYTVTVQAGGAWSVNTETATPTSGTLGIAGLTSYAKITVSGSDQAGNSTTTTALNKPTVNALTTNDTTPSLSGSWTNLGTDTLTVTVNGTTYTSGTGLAIAGNSWSLTTNALTAGTYNVAATSTRGGSSATDATAGELIVDTTAPAVAITSAALTADTTPVLSGTTDLPAGALLTVTVDPDNDNTTNNAFTYTVIVGAGGSWSVDTGSALPTSGSFPASGLAGTVGVRVSGTDTAGNTTTATQTLIVDNVPPVIAITSNSKTPDVSPVISGTSDLAEGDTLTLQIDPNNDGNYADAYTYTLTVGALGVWSVDTGAVIPDGGGGTITLSGTVGLKATAADSVGNTASSTKNLTIDTSAPALTISSPVGDGNLSASEDDAVVIHGTTTDIPDGSLLTISITDGAKTITDTVTVTANAWAMAAIDLSSLSDGPIALTASYTDGDGNAFITTAAFIHDATPPSAALTAGSASITGPVTVTATFNEAVTGLTAGDFATSNGAVVSNLAQVNATTWTFTLTPAVNGTASVWLPADKVQDDAGNNNTLSSALNFSVNVGVPDTIAPTVTSIVRQTPVDALTNADAVTFRVTFSEATLGVDGGDFALSGAAASGASIQSVAAVSGQPGVYDVVVTGITNANGTLNLALVGSPSITDAAANALTATTPSLSEAYTLDNIAPALASVNGDVISYSSLVLSYDENLAAIAPATTDFAVIKNGATPISVTGVAVNTVNNTITLTLASAVSDTDTVTISYTAGGNKIEDLAGNAAANLSSRSVTNSTPAADSTAPAAPGLTLLASSDSGQNTSDGITNDDTPTVRVTLNGSGATAPVAGDTVQVYLGATQVGSATLSAGDIAAGYVDITTGSLGADGVKNLTAKITDAAANTSNASSVLGITLDTAAPGIASATVNNSTLTLTYDESLDSTTPAPGDFSVAVNGSAVTPVSVAVDTAAKTVTLTLPAPVSGGDTVTVSYTPGADQTQDPAGNPAASLSTQAVNNVTGDTTPPQLTSIDDGDADDIVAAGDLLTYTVTFNEDIDSSTVTAADFGNAGTAGISIGTITETSPGVFSVQVTTTSTGTLVLQVNAGAVIKDAAGNNLDTASALTDDTTVTVNDITAPAAPGLTLLTSSDSGQNTSDRITNDDTPTVRVSLNGSGFTAPLAGDIVKVYLGATQVAAATLNATDISNGYVDLTTSTLGTGGIKSLTATVTDAASNVSSPSAALGITLDTTVPGISAAAVNGDTLVLTYNETLDATSPAAGDFSVSVNGSAVIPSSVAVNTGAMSVTLTLPVPVNNGDIVTVSYTPGSNQTQDVAGNPAAALTSQAVNNATPDTTAPLLTSFDDGDADNSVVVGDVLTYTVSFNEDIDASTVTASDFGNAGAAGATIGAITETSPGVFSVQVTATSPGTLVLQVNAGAVIKDAAGNDLDTSGAIVDSVTVTVNDVTAPAAPGLALLASSDSGQNTSDGITNDDTPTVRVTLNGSGATAPVAGDTVQVYLGATQVGSATLSAGDIAAGYVDITTGSLGADGVKNLTAKITDAAANTSGPSGALSITLDTASPTLSSAVIDGGTLTLTYGETLDSTAPAAGDFTVMVNGSAVTPSSVIVDTNARTVTLTLPAAVNNGDTVAVSYTPSGNQTQDVAGNLAASLTLQAASNTTADTTPPTLVSFDDGDADNTVVVGDVLTYTVTFSEDIDASTVSAASFGNAGTAGVSIGTITETSPGVFSVRVTATGAGTIQLQINAGAVIKDAAGNSLNTSSAIVDSTTVVANAAAPATSPPPVLPRIEQPAPVPTSSTTASAAAANRLAGFPPAFSDAGSQTFSSLLGLAPALDPSRPLGSFGSFINDGAGRSASDSRGFEHILTSRGENAFRIAVAKADEAALLVFRGVPDQDVGTSPFLSFKVRADAFVHTDPRAVIALRALLMDGRPLPKWLRFDPVTGKFEGKPPRGTQDTLSVLVVARDGEGREAATIFRIKLGKAGVQRDVGRAGLSEQLRLAANRAGHLERYANLSSEPTRVKLP